MLSGIGGTKSLGQVGIKTVVDLPSVGVWNSLYTFDPWKLINVADGVRRSEYVRSCSPTERVSNLCIARVPDSNLHLTGIMSKVTALSKPT
jgi:hypothetical protein